MSPGARSTAARSPGKNNRGGLGGAAWRGEDAPAKDPGVGSGGVRGGRLRSKPVAPSHPVAGNRRWRRCRAPVELEVGEG